MQKLVFWGLNRIGDAVYTLPLLDALSEKYEVTIFTRSFLAPLYSERPVSIKTISSLTDGWKTLRAVQPESVILLHNAAKYAVVAWVAGIPERVGYNKEYRKPFLTKWLPYPKEMIHRLEYNARLGELLNVNARGRLPEVPVSASTKQRVLDKFGLFAKSYVVFVVGSIAPSRRLFPVKFIAMAQQVIERGLRVVIVGGQSDQQIANKISDALPVMDLTGRTTLDETIALFSTATGVISNDTGPMHLAGATGVPVVTWFGPARKEEILPPFDNVDVFFPDLPCLGCLKEICPLKHNACLHKVDEKERIEALLGRWIQQASATAG